MKHLMMQLNQRQTSDAGEVVTLGMCMDCDNNCVGSCEFTCSGGCDSSCSGGAEGMHMD